MFKFIKKIIDNLFGKKKEKCKINPEDFRVGFLWKPIAENSKKLVVLMPPSATGRTVHSAHLELGGSRIETASYSGVHNGGREHYRFSKPGGGYPPGVVFVCRVDGCGLKYTIANPSSRYDGSIRPSV